MKFVRIAAYIICLAGFVWLGLENIRFRRALRGPALGNAYSALYRILPDRADATDSGKVLNSYYEDIYDALPRTFLPGVMLFGGATILLFNKRFPKPETLHLSANV
jgi:hypothetical protein